MPALSQDQWVNLNNKVLRLQPGSSRDNVALVLRALASPSEQFRGMGNNHLIKPAIMAMAASYCGASADDTLTIVWDECADWLRKHYPSLIADELLEAFRFASSPRCAHPVNFAAYSGRFTVEILKQVMAAYMAERNAIHHAIERGLVEMTAEHAAQVEAEKNRSARAQFVSEFRQMKADAHVPEFSDIRFWWFDALVEVGEINFAEDEKKELWEQAAQILRTERIDDAGSDRFNTVGIRRLLQQWTDTEAVPEEWRGRRENIYKKLLIRQALMNAAMDRVEVVRPERISGNDEIPF